MEGQRTYGRRANALRRELVITVRQRCAAPAEAVFDILTDLRSHLVWAGEQQKKNTRLTSMDAPAGPVSVGTEFQTTGTDPMGRFSDQSVVTEALRSSVFEFVTEAHFETKKGKVADWTNVNRYELASEPGGCRVTYAVRITRISALPGMLALFNVPLLAPFVLKVAGATVRRSVRNLTTLAEQRAAS